ncbi:MAG: hypothetical protein J6T16_00580 [Opitutales bacterium]|nr:hypothetical protein [Opitutales bacterium]
MNIKKSTLLTAAFGMALASFAAEEQAAATATPATQAAEDAPRIAEFQKNKLPIIFVEDQANKSAKSSYMDFEELVPIDGVVNFKLAFTDGTPGSIFVPIDRKGVKFKYRVTDELKRMRKAYTGGRWEAAVEAGRHVVYPAVDIMGIPEELTNVQENLPPFVESLAKAGRFIEAKSLMESLPLSKATPTVGVAVVRYANLAIDAGKFKDATDILKRMNFGGANLANAEGIMQIAHKLRKLGRTSDAVELYTRLQATPQNPLANESKMWMAYCDVLKNNDISARLFVDELKSLPKTEGAFSLRCLVNGMLFEKQKKFDDALDSYAEGIVYGDLSSEWMPNMLFNIAKLYKANKDFVASNEIFEQITLLYPASEYSKPSQGEIVEIKEEKSEDEEGEEEEE